MRRKTQGIVLAILMVFNFAVIAQDGSSPVQSDALVRVDKAQRQHHSGVAGHVMFTDETVQDPVAIPYQTTIGVYVKIGNKGKLRLKQQLLTAEDGTFYLDLQPGNYVIQPIIPEWEIIWDGFSGDSIPVKIRAKQITPIEVGVFEAGGGSGGVITISSVASFPSSP